MLIQDVENNDKFTELQDKLNQLHLLGCEKIQCGNVLYYPIRDINLCNKQKLNPFLRIPFIFIKSLFQDIDISITGNASTVMLFSRSYMTRIDYLDSFNKVTEIIENKLVVKPKSKIKIFNFLNLIRLFRWNRQMKKVIPDLAERWYYLGYIYEAYIDYRLIEKCAKKRGILIRNLVTWCDVHAIDCFITQMYNLLGRTTVTLQHGIFSENMSRWGIEGSLSKYFMAYGQYTVDEAMKVGYKNTMLKVGMPSSIGISTFKENNGMIKKSYKILKIGVLLDGPLYADDNKRSILFLQKFCKNNDIELYLKFHPATKIIDYKNLIDKDVIKNCFAKDITVSEFADTVDLLIVRNSTSFLQMIEQKKPVLIIYDSIQKVDVYKSIQDIRFSTYEELKRIINEIGTEKYQKVVNYVSKYLCTGGNIKKNYKKVFNSIGIQ